MEVDFALGFKNKPVTRISRIIARITSVEVKIACVPPCTDTGLIQHSHGDRNTPLVASPENIIAEP